MNDEGRGLFGPILWRGAVFHATSDSQWLQAMLDAEAALVAAQADLGFTDDGAAHVVSSCCRAERFDVETLGRAAMAGANPVIALVRELSQQVEATSPNAARAVHRGATSQDIIDTAAMLVARNSLQHIEATLDVAGARCAVLADTYRVATMAARTLGQQAAPTSFGFKAAGWLTGLVAARRRLNRLRTDGLAAQLGGAVGTLSVYGDAGPELLGAFSRRLGLVEPVLAWHSDRTRIGDLAGALATTAGVVAKIANDLVLLAQSEVGEAQDTAPGRGGSSAMPHKRNPVAAIAARAAALQAPGLAATLFAAMDHEHERAWGTWHAEWRPFTDLLRAVGSAVDWLADALEHLRPDVTAMAANLQRSAGLLYAELVAAALSPTLGRLGAMAVVEEAGREAQARQVHLEIVLAERPDVMAVFDRDRLAALFDPSRALGSADRFIDRALAAFHHDRPPTSSS